MVSAPHTYHTRTHHAEEKRSKYVELVKKDKEFQDFLNSFDADKAKGVSAISAGTVDVRQSWSGLRLARRASCS